jgi:hypothetical protein
MVGVAPRQCATGAASAGLGRARVYRARARRSARLVHQAGRRGPGGTGRVVEQGDPRCRRLPSGHRLERSSSSPYTVIYRGGPGLARTCSGAASGGWRQKCSRSPAPVVPLAVMRQPSLRDRRAEPRHVDVLRDEELLALFADLGPSLVITGRLRSGKSTLAAALGRLGSTGAGRPRGTGSRSRRAQSARRARAVGTDRSDAHERALCTSAPRGGLGRCPVSANLASTMSANARYCETPTASRLSRLLAFPYFQVRLPHAGWLTCLRLPRDLPRQK